MHRQITAVGVSFVPLWSLAVALYKYPALRKKQREHLARAAGQASSSTDSISAAPPSSPPVPAHGSHAVSVIVIGSRGRLRGHAPRPSDASSTSSGEEHEMVPLAGRGHTSPHYSHVPLADPDSPPLPRRPSGPRDAPRRRHTYTRHPSGSGSDHLTP